ncbi:Arc family DNA-binding protein [Pandoraea apista]|uniref:Arc family DNA-binding protein n=1 Tax=Pandoraea apista TaxID=93218 RepID=UPI0012E32465|nr:Arc family DNA-binding protein [Pandoraea apista]
MPQVNIRMPEDLKRELEQDAAKNFRSLTAEILSRLVAGRSKENAQPAATGQALVTQ